MKHVDKKFITLEDYRQIKILRHQGLADEHIRRVVGLKQRSPEFEAELAEDFLRFKREDA